MHSNSEPTEIFRSSWSLYDAIIDANYMFHHEIAENVSEVVAEFSTRSTYTVLDLGCGNARGIATALRNQKPMRYVGVDVSRPALEEAAIALRGIQDVQLIERDMLACVDDLVAKKMTFDLIHSSFAMHHLNIADKSRLFQQIANALAPDGVFLLIDIVRGEDQSREDYLETYLGFMDQEWGALTASQKQEVRQHVTAFDFPETKTVLHFMARSAGFEDGRLLGQYREHLAIRFKRSAHQAISRSECDPPKNPIA